MLQISTAAPTFPSLQTQDKITWNFLILLLNIGQTIPPSRVRQGDLWLFFMERSQDNIKSDQPARKMGFHIVYTHTPQHTIYHVITLVKKSKKKSSCLLSCRRWGITPCSGMPTGFQHTQREQSTIGSTQTQPCRLILCVSHGDIDHSITAALCTE